MNKKSSHIPDAVEIDDRLLTEIIDSAGGLPYAGQREELRERLILEIDTFRMFRGIQGASLERKAAAFLKSAHRQFKSIESLVKRLTSASLLDREAAEMRERLEKIVREIAKASGGFEGYPPRTSSIEMADGVIVEDTQWYEREIVEVEIVKFQDSLFHLASWTEEAMHKVVNEAATAPRVAPNSEDEARRAFDQGLGEIYREFFGKEPSIGGSNTGPFLRFYAVILKLVGITPAPATAQAGLRRAKKRSAALKRSGFATGRRRQEC